jgi:hypothetical protein
MMSLARYRRLVGRRAASLSDAELRILVEQMRALAATAVDLLRTKPHFLVVPAAQLCLRSTPPEVSVKAA